MRGLAELRAEEMARPGRHRRVIVYRANGHDRSQGPFARRKRWLQPGGRAHLPVRLEISGKPRRPCIVAVPRAPRRSPIFATCWREAKYWNSLTSGDGFEPGGRRSNTRGRAVSGGMAS